MRHPDPFPPSPHGVSPSPRGRRSDPRPYWSRRHRIFTAAAAKFAVISLTADPTVWTNGHQVWCTHHGQRLTWPAADLDNRCHAHRRPYLRPAAGP